MTKNKQAPFKFTPFSKKQMQVLTWWNESSPVHDKDGIICDGAIRAGKTLVMSLSFVIWAMETFCYKNLIMAGKTIGSFRRNVLVLLKIILRLRGYKVKDKRSDNLLIIQRRKTGKINYFYIFGGSDESSQDLILGLTSAGAFFDEVAIMPQSFVNQAIGRCSVSGAKIWFNCNPDGPYHWFNVEFLKKIKEKNLLHIHFLMDDNPSIDAEKKSFYLKQFPSGIFYKRYILGRWVAAEGIIYDMFSENLHVVNEAHPLWPKDNRFEEYYITIDYGTQNACVFLLIGKYRNRYFIIKEYYYSGKEVGKQKSDPKYMIDFNKFVEGIAYKSVVIDPSAASFIALLKESGHSKIRKAANDVEDGIREVASRLSNLELFVHQRCGNTIKEFTSYIWDKKASEKGVDKPVKQHDHAMDATRYFVYTILCNGKPLIQVQTTTYKDVLNE